MDRILLFIPMYNCEKQITRVLGQLDKEILKYITEVIVVNNRSTDHGEEAAVDYCRQHPDLPVKVFRNNENYGLGGSHKVAFQYAVKNNYDYVIVFHGDDQGRISDLLPLLQNKIHKKYKCCLGSRFMKGSKLIGYSRFRTFRNLVFNILFSIVLGQIIYDLGAGLNLYSVEIMKSEYYKRFPDNLTFNCYMLFALSSYRQPYIFFPISWREEDQISNVKITGQAYQTLKMALLYSFKRNKYMLKEAREVPFAEYTYTTIWNNILT